MIATNSLSGVVFAMEKSSKVLYFGIVSYINKKHSTEIRNFGFETIACFENIILTRNFIPAN